MSSNDPLRIATPAPTGSGAVDEAVVLLRALTACGLGSIVLAPGSRSAPLVYALTAPDLATSLDAHVRIDERAAAFTALGLSRHDPGHPAAVATTSGTATAHLLAAVMEAHHSRIPLVVLTADRPAELRGAGANQTTDQRDLFTRFVRFHADVPAPTAPRASDVELRLATNLAARAMAAATGEDPGPVHLNLCFRDPLVPQGGRVGPDGTERITLTRRTPPASPAPVEIAVDARTVVLAGDGAGPQAAEFARTASLPLLAEPSSGARYGATFIPGYPAALHDVMTTPGHPLRPQRVVTLGHPTLSRAVMRDLLGADDVEQIVVDPTLRWNDAARRATLVVPAAMPAPLDTARDRADAVHAWTTLAQQHAAPDHTALTWQARAALDVWEASGAGDLLVLGASALVRDLDQHAGSTRACVIANRGLAGIDGTLSMATGLALRHRAGRVRVLVGDITALHDATGLLIGPLEQEPDLQMIVVDDGGGRIFSGLEHAQAPTDLLERFFTTPHGTHIAELAAACGARARSITPNELPSALAATDTGRQILVVQASSSADSPSSRTPGVR